MNGRELTVAAIQMSSTPHKDENLATAEQLIHGAASAGADLVALPGASMRRRFTQVHFFSTVARVLQRRKVREMALVV